MNVFPCNEGPTVNENVITDELKTTTTIELDKSDSQLTSCIPSDSLMGEEQHTEFKPDDFKNKDQQPFPPPLVQSGVQFDVIRTYQGYRSCFQRSRFKGVNQASKSPNSYPFFK